MLDPWLHSNKDTPLTIPTQWWVEYFKVGVKIPSHLHIRRIRRAGRGAVGRKVGAATSARAQILPTTHCVCVTLRATCFCNPFSWALLMPHKCWRGKQSALRFSLLWPLCAAVRLWKWSVQCLLIPQCPVHALCRPHTTSHICKPSQTTVKLGTHLLIFREFQLQMPKALSYGNTLEVASCFH